MIKAREATEQVVQIYKQIRSIVLDKNFNPRNNGETRCYTLTHAYKILGSPQNTLPTKAQALKQYKNICLQIHSDKLKTETDAATQYLADYLFKLVNEAKDTITEAEDRVESPVIDTVEFPNTAAKIARQTRKWVNDNINNSLRNDKKTQLLAWRKLKSNEEVLIAMDIIRQPHEDTQDATRFQLAKHIHKIIDEQHAQSAYERELQVRAQRQQQARTQQEERETLRQQQQQPLPATTATTATTTATAAAVAATATAATAATAAAAAAAAATAATAETAATAAAAAAAASAAAEAEAAASATAQQATAEAAAATAATAAAAAAAAAAVEAERLAQQRRAIAEEAAETARRNTQEWNMRQKARPPMPRPLQQTHENSWKALDHVPIDECYLGHVPHIATIPTDFTQPWAAIFSTILERVITAHRSADDEAITRALKWYLAIHHILLRNPKRGVGPGDRQFISEISQRFRLLEEGNYTELVAAWRKAQTKYSHRKARKPKTEAEIQSENATKAVQLALEGHISRAVRLVEQHSKTADLSRPEVQRQAQSKHPIRELHNFWSPQDIGDRPKLEIDCTPFIRHLDPKSGTGPSGFSNTYLIPLLNSKSWTNGSPESLVVHRLNLFGELYMNDKLPLWFSHKMMSVKQIGIDKKKIWTDGNTDYRFLGVGENVRRLFWNAAFKKSGGCFQQFAEPQQLALGTKAGGQMLALGTAALIELYPDHVFVKDDLTNMFGVAIRKEGIKNVLADPNCSEFHRALNMEAYAETDIYYKDAKGKMIKASWIYSEGGQQGATSSLILACAAIQPYLRELDEALRPYGGSARKGIDDGVTHGPPHILYPLLEKYYAQIRQHCGLTINRNSSMVYSPTGNYEGMPQGFSIGYIIATVGPPHQQTQQRAEGLDIWGAAVSADSNYILAKMAKKEKKVCSTINKITKSLNPRNSDVTMTVIRLSLYNRLQYSQQCQQPQHMIEINSNVQRSLDNALTETLGFDIKDPASFSLTPHTLLDPTLVSDTMSLPAKAKGMGLRSMNGHRGLCAYIGGWYMVAKQFIDIKDEEGNTIHNGLYPLLEPFLGAASQDSINADNRWTKFTDGNSILGNQFRQSVVTLAAMCQGTPGPLAYPVEAIRTISKAEHGDKLQKELTKQIDKASAVQIQARYDALPNEDRRNLAYQHRQPMTMAALTTAPTIQSQVPQSVFTGVAALILGAIDPNIRHLIGAQIGDTQRSKVDEHGDALANAQLPGDRWRIAHDAIKDQIFMDATTMGIRIQTEKYGLFTRFMTLEGQQRYNQESTKEKKTQTIVPDLVTQHHPAHSPIHAPGLQMWEIKRIHSPVSINRFTGRPSGLNQYYKPKRGQIQNAANNRADKIAGEYEAKAKNTDKKYGAQGSSSVLDALRNMPRVRGLAIGAFGEFSDSIELLIKGIALEGSIKNAALFGQTDQVKAQSMISWWLKKRWNRLSLVTAVQCRYDALRYVGGSAQQQAAENHTRLQRAEDEYIHEEGRRYREQEAQYRHH